MPKGNMVICQDFAKNHQGCHVWHGIIENYVCDELPVQVSFVLGIEFREGDGLAHVVLTSEDSDGRILRTFPSKEPHHFLPGKKHMHYTQVVTYKFEKSGIYYFRARINGQIVAENSTQVFVRSVK